MNPVLGHKADMPVAAVDVRRKQTKFGSEIFPRLTPKESSEGTAIWWLRAKCASRGEANRAHGESLRQRAVPRVPASDAENRTPSPSKLERIMRPMQARAAAPAPGRFSMTNC